jgi:glycosyltransferase involved in cell wall biosynthesis
MCIADLLSIYIITFNRSCEIERTLDSLNSSGLSKCKIIVLDNHSTDNTKEVVLRKMSKNQNISIYTNRANIGAPANIIQAFILSRTQYTWVMCDDDSYDFSVLDDVIEVMRESSVKMILVGGHYESVRKGKGQKGAPKSLMGGEFKVEFYRDTSFLPGAIYLTEFAVSYLVDCYRFCYFSYPQMALVFKSVSENCAVYVSKNRWVTASIVGQSYSVKDQLVWWFGLANKIANADDRKVFLCANHKGPLDPTGLYGFINTAIRNGCYNIAISTILLHRINVVTVVLRMLWKRALILIAKIKNN